MSGGTNRLAAANAARAARHQLRQTSSALQGLRRGTSSDVRRNSYHAGDHEKRKWSTHNTFSAAVRNERVRQVRAWSMSPAQKKAGNRRGPLSFRTPHIYDVIMSFRNFENGACFPSIKGIARRANVAIATVDKAIKELVDAGLLGKLLRTRPVEDPDPKGPQVEQITTAYWFLVPTWLAKALKAKFGSAPKPDDQVQREQDDAEHVQRMLDTLSAEDLAAFRLGDQTVLAKALASFGRAHDRIARFQSVETIRDAKI